MDVKTYCDNIGAELNSWKAKLYDVIRKTESLRAGEKERGPAKRKRSLRWCGT